ncbi:MAG: hypothetical protein CR982_04275 [Candidatus Cloacimonadota bacterium]|nr:MAG: hypothetical protein CR982_04275 [Candidatus Cloacimonadota bacterium]PIE78496.1 MAG: hypothetical protein CSA15_07315 [Candidatus Delongbacteria bacterium]
MIFTIVGDGAVGLFIGYILSSNNEKVFFKGIDKKRPEKVRILGKMDDSYTPKYIENYHQITPSSVIIIAVKAYDLSIVLDDLIRYNLGNNRIILIQNGLNLLKERKSYFPNCYRFILTAGLSRVSSEEVIYNGGEIFIPKSMDTEILKGFKHEITILRDDLDTVVNNKFIVNCIINPLTTIFGCKNRGILNKEAKSLVFSIYHEIGVVFNAHNINFTIGVDEILEISDSDNRSSMFQDYENGNSNELEFLNSYLLELAEEFNISVPVNNIITKIVKSMFEIRGL